MISFQGSVVCVTGASRRPHPAQPDSLPIIWPLSRNQQVAEHRQADRPLFPPRLHFGQTERPRTPANRLSSGGVGGHFLFQKCQVVAQTPAKM
jgi:hypothetical protein